MKFIRHIKDTIEKNSLKLLCNLSVSFFFLSQKIVQSNGKASCYYNHVEFQSTLFNLIKSNFCDLRSIIVKSNFSILNVTPANASLFCESCFIIVNQCSKFKLGCLWYFIYNITCIESLLEKFTLLLEENYNVFLIEQAIKL